MAGHGAEGKGGETPFRPPACAKASADKLGTSPNELGEGI